jgi:thymidylate synthase
MKTFVNSNITPPTKEEFINKIKTDNEFAKQWGELGPIYGKQWRSWERYDKIGQHYSSETQKIEESDILRRNPIDQIANLISELKTNPDSRRLIVNAWNVGELDQMVLPPCHYGFQVYTRELTFVERKELYTKITPVDELRGSTNMNEMNEWFDKLEIPKRAISLMWNQRSVDTFLGLPFNIASYGLLLEIIAKEVNMVPEELIGNLGDVHLYSNHIEQAKEQIGRTLSVSERVNLANDNDVNISLKLGDYNFVEKKLDSLRIPTETREPYPLPTLKIKPTLFEFGKPDPNKLDLDYYSIHNFELENYRSHPAIKAPLSN